MGQRHPRTRATPAVVSRGRKQGHPRKHPTLARTYQEHNPSKPAVDARGVPSIEQLAHLDAKPGDKQSPPQAVSCLAASRAAARAASPCPSARSPATSDKRERDHGRQALAAARRRLDTQPSARAGCAGRMDGAGPMGNAQRAPPFGAPFERARVGVNGTRWAAVKPAHPKIGRELAAFQSRPAGSSRIAQRSGRSRSAPTA
jgi:hypothetical protein